MYKNLTLTVLLRINAGGVHLIFEVFFFFFWGGGGGGGVYSRRRLHEGGVYYKIQKSYNSIYQRQLFRRFLLSEKRHYLLHQRRNL